MKPKRSPLTFVFLAVLKFGIFGPRLTGLDGPVVQILLQTHQAAVSQYGVAAVRVGALVVGCAGVGVIVGQQVVFGSRGVDGAVDGAVGGRRAAFLHLVRVIENADCWTKACRVTLTQNRDIKSVQLSLQACDSLLL